MPILRLVNSRGTRLTRDIMNYEIDRFATRRTIPRRAMRTPPGKIGIPGHQDTSRRCSLGSITRFMLRQPVRPGHERSMSLPLLGLPRLFFYRKKNWLNFLNASVSSISVGTGISRERRSHQRHGKTIASSHMYWLTSVGARLRRLKHRFDLRSRRLSAQRLRFRSTCSSSSRHCGTSGSLQHIFDRNCRAVTSDSHPSWTAGARASVSPGSPAGLACIRILESRSQRLRFCSTNSATSLCPETTGRPQHSSTRNCLHNRFPFSPELYTCWTAGARESVSPGSPVGSVLSVAKCLRFGAREDIFWPGMDETSAPLPFVTSSLYPGLEWFHFHRT